MALAVSEFSDALRAARTAAGYSQFGLAHLAGLTDKAIISGYEIGARVPRRRRVRLLECALGLPPGSLERHVKRRPLLPKSEKRQRQRMRRKYGLRAA